MKIKVLGSSGSEAPGHNSPAFLLDDFLLLDAGTIAGCLDRDAQCRITHILLTHAHLDHVKGIPSLLDNIVASKQNCQLAVISGKEVLADLKRNIFNDRIWPNFAELPSIERPVMRYQAISSRNPLLAGGYTIRAVPVSHNVPAYGYIVADGDGNALVYTGDSGPTERIWKVLARFRARVLITEVSFPNHLRSLADASGHMTPGLFAKEIRKLSAIPDRILITHVKPYYRDAIQTEMARLDGVSVEFLRDGMEILVTPGDGCESHESAGYH
ncbi:MAG TPA: MBL fold metallo-hydrolase [Syntrophobacteraceae bacterium]|nr:MBL fold metallo-hydrolase [Syntrophobacteraceae bacterium]